MLLSHSPTLPVTRSLREPCTALKTSASEAESCRTRPSTCSRIKPVHDSPVVVVSGASCGIGEDAALFLNQLGYLVAAGIRREPDGDLLQAKAVDPERLRPVVFDVTSDDQVAAARQTIEGMLETGRRFAGVFSNAGVAHYEGDTSSEGTPMNVRENVMDINFLGGVRFIRAFLPLARAARGRIIINSALMARTVLPFNAGYAASKCALEGWADSLRREVGPYGVRVVLIEAAAISTGLTRETVTPSRMTIRILFSVRSCRRPSGASKLSVMIPAARPGGSRRSSCMHCRRRVHESGTTSEADRAPSTRSERYPMESRTAFLGDSLRLRRRQAVMADGCADEFVSEL